MGKDSDRCRLLLIAPTLEGGGGSDEEPSLAAALCMEIGGISISR